MKKGRPPKQPLEETAEEKTATSSKEKQIDTIVVTGSRLRPRSVLDSAVPIDVIGGDDFTDQGAEPTRSNCFATSFPRSM